MIQRRPTIIDVAKQAGISKSTVSLVLQNSSSVRCDIAGIGVQAAMTVVDWLENRNAPPPETRTSVSLSIRQSSGRAIGAS